MKRLSVRVGSSFASFSNQPLFVTAPAKKALTSSLTSSNTRSRSALAVAMAVATGEKSPPLFAHNCPLPKEGVSQVTSSNVAELTSTDVPSVHAVSTRCAATVSGPKLFRSTTNCNVALATIASEGIPVTSNWINARRMAPERARPTSKSGPAPSANRPLSSKMAASLEALKLVVVCCPAAVVASRVTRKIATSKGRMAFWLAGSIILQRELRAKTRAVSRQRHQSKKKAEE